MAMLGFILLLLTSLSYPAYSQGITVFKDTFENYNSGLNLQGVVPEIGLRWYDYGTAGRDIVSNIYPRQGVRSMYVRRDVSGTFTYPVLAGEGAKGSDNEVFPSGEPFYFSFCWYQTVVGYDRPSVWADFGTYSGIAGVRVGIDNKYQVWDQSLNSGAGGYLLTDASVSPNSWEKIQMMLYPGSDSGDGNVQFLYHVYVIREDGSRIKIADQVSSRVRRLAMSAGQYVGNNAVITFYCEPPSGTSSVKPYFDDIQIIKGYIPDCGSAEYIPPVGDLDGNCQVDIADLSLVAEFWLQ